MCILAAMVPDPQSRCGVGEGWIQWKAERTSRDGQIWPPTAGYEGERKGVAVGVAIVMLMLGTQGPHRRPGRGSPAST